MIRFISLIFLFSFLITCSIENKEKSYDTWGIYNGSKDGIKYSSLSLIDTSNVKNLKVAWIYNTGDADTVHASQIQFNPIVIDDKLYGVSAQMKLFCIDAATGKHIWTFDPTVDVPHSENREFFHIMINSRGVAYWTDGKEDKRLFFTAGSYTYAIDAQTGKPINSFGKNGFIDLHEDLDRDVSDLFVVNNSPGVVFQNLLILGSRVDETMPSAPGHIRAYDVKTGKKMWVFHTIPHPGEEGYETWENPKAYTFFGGVNCWSGMTLDEEKGILFVPLGSAASDFYGGKRRGSNLYANCLVALDAKSGKKIWHQQIVHHDLWDKDLPTPPILIKVKRNGKDIEAVAQCTKNGQVFVFDRTNGHPLYEVVETKVDTISELDGEKVWPTQPIPIKPAPFCRQNLTIDDINPYVSSEEKKSLTKEMASYRFGNMFIPPGNNPSLVFPGYDGGGEWGGPAFDIKTGVMYVNSNEMAWIMKMIPNEKEKSKDETWAQAGQRLVSRHCFSCHGIDLKGSGNNPSLVDINKKYNKETMLTMINSGRRMMPSFKRLHDEEKNAIASFVLNIKEDMNKKFAYKYPDVSENHMPFKLEEYKKFLTKEGYPAISPPWGTLNAIDLNTGEYKWKIALGEYAKLKEKGIPATGTENYGGPVVTAGGLLFIAATSDNMFRAFDKESGKLLWQYKLPASGFATPSVYSIRGKQYVVIACGGGKLNTKSGDAYVAFCL